MSRPCKYCSSLEHTSFYCRLKPRKKIPQRGKRAIKYDQWRDTVAKPHLDETSGRKCNNCGAVNVQLDVDHIKNRGSRPDLKMNLSNLQYLCRDCHSNKTDHLNGDKINA